jgi:hypothetical protein
MTVIVRDMDVIVGDIEMRPAPLSDKCGELLCFIRTDDANGDIDTRAMFVEAKAGIFKSLLSSSSSELMTMAVALESCGDDGRESSSTVVRSMVCMT